MEHAEQEPVTSDELAFARRDHARLREAGFELATAAARVIQDYDGLHRLSLAVSGWFQAWADQGDRGKRAVFPPIQGQKGQEEDA